MQNRNSTDTMRVQKSKTAYTSALSYFSSPAYKPVRGASRGAATENSGFDLSDDLTRLGFGCEDQSSSPFKPSPGPCKYRQPIQNHAHKIVLEESCAYDSARTTIICAGTSNNVVELVRARVSGEQTPVAKENCPSGEQQHYAPLMDE